MREREAKSEIRIGGDAVRAALVTEATGWFGAASLLLAFALGATQIVEPSSAVYLGLNLAGAMGLARASFSRKAYSPALLNAIWAAIAAFSLLFLLFRA